MTEVAKIDRDAAELMPADPMVSMIERVAMDPNADIDKLERMLAMKERLENKAAETAFNEAKAAAQAEMPAIAARHNNDQTRSRYAKLKDIYDECKPILATHGFSFSAVPVIGGRDGYINMRWTLSRAGHSISDVSEVPIDDKGMKGTANKTQTHAYGSTTSYGRRYLFCAVFDVAIGDDDDGQAGAQAGSGDKFPAFDLQVITETAPNGTPEEKAKAVADALCAQWKRKKSEKQLSNEWDRRTADGTLPRLEKFPTQYDRVVDAYEARMIDFDPIRQE